ncbi:GNAT family N-acetyltransferase [Cytobacillus sp.]|uniref:GNAT family N-acetyltransferase n=1 Tax=Cytobacillus sp. TaxID=2675269 RepID=UPI0028BDE29B|nr:GNAT family N-acetyltransferase [Cytobacillus sp.]
MNVKVEKLSIKDAKDLFQFECENKSFFEKSVPPRGNDYYDYNKFLILLDSLLEEQNKRECLFYLIKNEKGDILGRMNIVDIDPANGHGSLGYRVGYSYTGKGVATQALKRLKEMIIQENTINLLSAKTTVDNIGSQKVLEKNGFKIDNHYKGIKEKMNDRYYEFIYYNYFFK